MTDASLTRENGQLNLAGPITIATVAPLLKQVDAALAGSPAGDLVLNCAGMTLSDSAAIALLVEIQRRAGQRGTRLRIEGVREQLVSLITIYGLDWLLA